MASARTRVSWAAYQLGRLGGYLALGALAGGVGGQFFGNEPLESAWAGYASWAAALFLGFSFVVIGVRVWRGHSVHPVIVPQSVLSRLYRWAGSSPWQTGLLSALLPCGWLHTFVLGAVAIRRPFAGMIFLFFFWLGTLPALALTPLLAARIFRPISRRSPKVAALVLIAAGILSIGIKVLPAATKSWRAAEQSSCH